MTVYVAAATKIKDRAVRDWYARAFPAVFDKFIGAPPAADFEAKALAGQGDGDRLAVQSFPSQGALTAWLTSPDDRAISLDRNKGAAVTAVLANEIEGLGSNV